MSTLVLSEVKTTINETVEYATVFTKESEENRIDSFLDAINDVNEKFEHLISLTNKLEVLVYNRFNTFSIDEKKYVVKALHDVIQLCYQNIFWFESSPILSSCFKTMLKKYKNSIASIVEIKADLEASILFSDDADYNSIIDSFLK